jgi:hypothetical protein
MSRRRLCQRRLYSVVWRSLSFTRMTLVGPMPCVTMERALEQVEGSSARLLQYFGMASYEGAR